MLGTPWEPVLKQKYILFLEDIDEPGYKLDRLLQQLRHSQFFANCTAIALGHFTQCQNFEQIFAEFSNQCKIPVYQGLLMGHESPRIPLLMGQKIDVAPRPRGLLLSLG